MLHDADSNAPTTVSGPIEGEVKWFDAKKGFGFISGPSGEDVFVHFSAIKSDGFRTLKDGEQVRYELCHGDKGLHARNVTRVAGPARTSQDELAEAAE